MEDVVKGQLLAWEALAREAFKLLTPEQREQAKQAVIPGCSRVKPDAVAAAATAVIRSLR